MPSNAARFRTTAGWLKRHWMAFLVGGAPIAAGLQYASPERHAVIFFAAAVAIVPFAAYIGRATDDLSTHFGGGLAGLLNATFGNAAELIIGISALRHGLTDLVKASLTGSIIGNVLLVFGLSAFVGGLKHPVQRFDRRAAGLGSTMLLLSAIGLTVPAVFHALARGTGRAPELKLDTEIAAVLMSTYLASLFFRLKTHRKLYAANGEDVGSPSGSIWAPLAVLAIAVAGVSWMSELLVDAISDTAHTLGLSNLFIGVVIVAIVGNSAEHFSAVLMAARNKMDTAISIAVGSSTQIALFVAPLLVFVSYAVAPAPMDLLFTVFEVAAVGFSVVTISLIAHDGETHWLEGVQLLAVYAILALGFYFLPSPGG